jgi:hypothetical protein
MRVIKRPQIREKSTKAPGHSFCKFFHFVSTLETWVYWGLLSRIQGLKPRQKVHHNILPRALWALVSAKEDFFKIS